MPSRLSSRRKIYSLLGLAWLFCVIIFYYFVHKPFNPEQTIFLLRECAQLAIAFGIISISGGVGRLLLVQLRDNSVGELALQSAFGLGIIGIVSLLVGVTVGFRSWVVWTITILAAVLFGRSILRWWQGWRALGVIYAQGGKLGKTIAWLAGLGAVCTLAAALLPPIKFDALTYHLALPRLYIENGRFGYAPNNIFWGMPQLGELIYTWVGALGGFQTAQVLGWFYPALALAGLLGVVYPRLGARPAWVAAGSLLAGYSLSSAFAWGYIDWLVILFGVALIILLDRWHEQMGVFHIWMISAAVGLALAVKYSAGILIFGVLVIILWHLGSGLPFRRAVLISALFLTGTLLVISPWLLKNLLATGNPVYPFIFPAGAMDASRLTFYTSGQAWGGWRDFWLLPWQATIYAQEGASGYGASIGPLLLGLAPLSWIGYRRYTDQTKALLRSSAILAGTGLLIWIILGRLSPYLIQSRLYFVIFPALAVLAGGGFAGLARTAIGNIRLGRIAGGLIVLVLLFTTFELLQSTIRQEVLPTVLAINNEEKYLETNLGMYYLAMQSVSSLPGQARTLLLFEPRSLYCLPKCTPDEILDRWMHDLRVYQSPEGVLAAWRQAGYDYLLYYGAGANFLQNEDERFKALDWLALEKMLGSLTTIKTFGDAYTLYSLNP